MFSFLLKCFVKCFISTKKKLWIIEVVLHGVRICLIIIIDITCMSQYHSHTHTMLVSCWTDLTFHSELLNRFFSSSSSFFMPVTEHWLVTLWYFPRALTKSNPKNSFLPLLREALLISLRRNNGSCAFFNTCGILLHFIIESLNVLQFLTAKIRVERKWRLDSTEVLKRVKRES